MGVSIVESRRGRTKPEGVVGAYGGGFQGFSGLEEPGAGGVGSDEAV